MVILRQETLFILQRSKAKFTPCWAILAHDPNEGPVLALFEDNTAKRAIEEKLPLAPIAPNIRFGTTTSHVENSPVPTPIKDPRVHQWLLVSLPNVFLERSGSGRKTTARSGSLWLASPALDQFYGFIKHLSLSLTTLGLPAPEPSPVESPAALHNYVPQPFRPENGWELFWDNPGPLLPPLGQLNSLEAARSATMSTISLNSYSRGTADTLRGYEYDEKAAGGTGGTAKSMMSQAQGKKEIQKKKDKERASGSGFTTMPPGLRTMAMVQQQQQPIFVHVLPKARELPKVSFKRTEFRAMEPLQMGNEAGVDMKLTSATITPQHQQPSPITVIQLLDDVIEEADMPDLPVPTGEWNNKRYLNAEVQTDESMASTVEGFMPLLLKTSTIKVGSFDGGDERDDAAGKSRVNGGEEVRQNGGRLNSASWYTSTTGTSDAEEGLTEELGGIVRFYNVQLTEKDEGRAAEGQPEEETTQF